MILLGTEAPSIILMDQSFLLIQDVAARTTRTGAAMAAMPTPVVRPDAATDLILSQ